MSDSEWKQIGRKRQRRRLRAIEMIEQPLEIQNGGHAVGIKIPPEHRLRAERVALNPFAVRREVDRQLQAIEAVRRRPEP